MSSAAKSLYIVTRFIAISGVLVLLVLAQVYFSDVWAQQQGPLLKADAPSRYTVEQGDTLWGIAVKFLNDPWRWQETWQANPSISDPDSISAGDVLVLSEQAGRPVIKALRRETVKLEPQIYSEPRPAVIPTIEPSAIQAFVRSPLMTDESELSQAGYVVGGGGETLVMGNDDSVYVRGVDGTPGDQYRVFRPGKIYRHLETGEALGQEARHIADLRLVRHGTQSSKMAVLSAHEEVALGDRLRPVADEELISPSFSPNAASDQLRGHIIDLPSRVGEAGPMAVVVLGLGSSDAVETGSVFRIYRAGEIRRDPITDELFELPEEAIGLALVFRAFDQLSFALITNASRPIRIGDTIISPVLSGLGEYEARFPDTGSDMDSNQRKEESLWRKFINKVRRN